MEQSIFNLFDAINREGIDNSTWGLCQDIANTREYFGTHEAIALQGQFVFLYRQPDQTFAFIDKSGANPVFVLPLIHDDGAIEFYQL